MNFLRQKRVVLTMWRESGDAPALVFIMFAQTVICLFRKWNIKRTYYSRLYLNIFAKTANLYVKLYGWYYMPASVHKILDHGAKIIESFLLIPIGLLSEAQESIKM